MGEDVVTTEDARGTRERGGPVAEFLPPSAASSRAPRAGRTSSVATLTPAPLAPSTNAALSPLRPVEPRVAAKCEVPVAALEKVIQGQPAMARSSVSTHGRLGTARASAHVDDRRPVFITARAGDGAVSMRAMMPSPLQRATTPEGRRRAPVRGA